jgi:glycosyltransferase involved in cell wall biosynthesis
MQFVRESLTRADVFNKDVLEVGSQDVNGSPREIVLPLGPRTYWGVDCVKGKGVDLVLDVQKIAEHFGPNSFDLVVSTEMMEHAEHWREAISVMKTVLRPGGVLLVTARGPGFPYHGFPYDFWRFTVADFEKIFSDMEVRSLQQDSAPGVLFAGVKKVETGSADLDAIEIQKVEVPPEMIQVEGSVDLIVANWNTLPWLKLLRSQFRRFHPRIPTSLFVWDNGSTDGSLEWLKNEGIAHFASPSNVSHAEGLHLALGMTKAPYVAFMDVDAIPIEWWWLDQAVGLLQKEKVGIAGLGAGTEAGHHKRFVHPSFCVFKRGLYEQLTLRPHIVHDYEKKTAFDVGETMCAKIREAGLELEFLGDTQLDIGQRHAWKNRVVHALSATPVLSEKRTDLPFVNMISSVVSWHKLLLGKLGIFEEFERYASETILRNPLASRYTGGKPVETSALQLSIVIPTIGRPELRKTLESILSAGIRPVDEVYVVADGKCPEARVICADFEDRLNLKYLETRKIGCFGGHQRNIGMGLARGTHVLFMDDDDRYKAGALDVVRKAVSLSPNVPHFFKAESMTDRRRWKVIWEEKRVFLGNLSSQMFVFPIVDGLLGTWPMGHCCDYGFIMDTIPRFGEDRIVWHEEVISELF